MWDNWGDDLLGVSMLVSQRIWAWVPAPTSSSTQRLLKPAPGYRMPSCGLVLPAQMWYTHKHTSTHLSNTEFKRFNIYAGSFCFHCVNLLLMLIFGTQSKCSVVWHLGSQVRLTLSSNSLITFSSCICRDKLIRQKE